MLWRSQTPAGPGSATHVGEDPADRTPSGPWASGHAGARSVLRLR